MMEARKIQTRSKSKIAVRKGSTLQNKENISNSQNRKGVESKITKTPTGRKTLSRKKDENSQDKPVVKLKPAKTAPDFAKLHKKWEAKLAKGKAVTKRAITKIEPFHLTKEVNAGLEDVEFDENHGLEVEDEDPDDILREKSDNVQQNTTACYSCGKQKLPREKATTPATIIREFKVPRSIRKTNLSSVKKKEKKEEIEHDPFEFKPDNKALQSILNDEGIKFTPRKTNTSAYCSPSPFNQKRTSIYYTGPRPDRPPTAFEKRLSMRRAAAMMAKMRQPENSFQPSNTVIGVQECGNRFTAATQFNELEQNPECIPEETSTKYRTHDGDAITYATDSPHTVENEISWADTLKYYSQSQQDNDSSIEDKDAFIAQLEEEVRQTMSNVALSEQHLVASAIKEPEPIRNSNVSTPLQQSRDKPSIYRRLFTSPSHVQKRQPIIEENFSNPEYLHTVNVTRSFTNNPSSLVEQSYHTKPSTIDMIGSGGFTRLPVDNTTEQHYRIPLGNCGSFSPSVSGRKIATLNIGVEEEIYGEISTPRGLQSFSNTWVAAPAVKDDDTGNYVDQRLFTCSTSQGFERIASNSASVAKSALVKKDGARNLNSGVSEGIATRSFINGSENETSGSLSVEIPTIAEKECAGYTSLVDAATASLNSKLRKKEFEKKSAFHRALPHNVEGTRPPSATNPCIPSSEQKILVPTPMRPVVARNNMFSHEMAPSRFISRHRQIMRDALIKSRDHAQEVLLDAEVSLYARNIGYLRTYDDNPRLVGPLAKLFNEGDERQFVPIKLG